VAYLIHAERTAASLAGGRRDGHVEAEAPTGIEPVASSIHGLEPNLAAWIERQAADAVRLYRPRFDVGREL
jgi:hypothetical protein